MSPVLSPANVAPSLENMRMIRNLPDVQGVTCRLTTDHNDGSRWVVRDLPVDLFRSDWQVRFQNEARLLGEIDCDTYNKMVSYEINDKVLRLFFAHRKGTSLAKRLTHSSLDPEATLVLARDLLAALLKIHSQGCVHRDWRPSHVIQSEQGHWILSGYGAVWRANLSAGNNPAAIEAVRYASPELAGIIKHDIGPASDLYSLGLILYSALSGRPLYDATTVSDLLLQQSTLDMDGDQLPGDTPPQLVSMLERLTHKEPRERYQSASAAYEDAEAILRMMVDGDDGVPVVIGRNEHRTELIDPAFVGRESQLAKLQDELREVAQGEWKRILVACASGMGKSRLNNEISRLATRKGFQVLHGDSIERATTEPNAPWMQVVNQVAKDCQTDPVSRSRLSEAMDDYREEVITAMPKLAEVFGWSGGRLAGPDEFGQGRVVAAFAALMTTLGSAERPTMLVLDNCQWFDDQSIRVLQRVSKSNSAYTLLLLSMRTDEAQAPKVRKTCHAHSSLEMGPLDRDSVRRLCESMAGVLPERAVSVVQDYAEGSPFMASAVLRGMVESSVLVSQNRRWQLNESRLEHFQTAASAGAVLAGRLKNLPPMTRDFMNAAAVIGSEFTLDAVVELSKIDLVQSFELLADVRRQRMVWSKPDGSYAFVHDKIRETILEQLSPDVKRQMHGRIGDYFAKTRPDQSYDLAYHFDEAGLHDRALPYALSAAKHARRNFSLTSGRRQLEIAARAFHVADDATRHEIESMMGEVLMLQGNYSEAETWVVRSQETAITNIDFAKVAMRQGELAFKRGDKEKAVDFYETALRQLKQPVCKSHLQLAPRLLAEIVTQIAHTILRRPCHPMRRELGAEELQVLRLYSNIAHGYWYVRDKYFTLWAHLRGLNRAERYQPTRQLAQAYSEHAPGMTLLGFYRRGIDYAMRSLAIRKQLNDVWGQGQSRNFMSILHYSFSNFDKCIDEASTAVSILERTGDFWEVHIARYQYAAALYRQGKLHDALDQARVNYRSAIRKSDYQGTGNIVEVWARASLGNIPFDILQMELKRNVDDAQRKCEVRLGCGVYYYYQSDYHLALNEFTTAVDLAESAAISNAYTSPCYAWRATAIRRMLETDPPKTPQRRLATLRQLRKAAKKAYRVAKRFTNELPHTLRELAAYYAITGKERKSQQLFKQSLAVAGRQGAQLEAIQTTLLYAEYGYEAGWSVDDVAVRDAAEQLHKLKLSVGAVNDRGSLSLVDRFDSLLEAGRRIAVSTDSNAIRQEIVAAASRLLRGDRVALIEPACEERDFATTPADVAFDPAILSQAERTGSAVVCEHERLPSADVTGANDQSDHHYGAFLCCPVRVRDNIQAYLYVANSYMMGMFGDDEVRIANYLASATGAAFEKADGFNQLQELNLTLEKKVAERTETLQQQNVEIERTADRLRATQVNLRDAKDAAVRANEAKSEFLARMSHEIRTPITAVLGYTELMLRGIVTDPDEQRQHLETIHGNGSHLLNLLNDILDLSKIEADRIEVERIECNPAKVISDVLESLSGKAQQKKISLQLDADSSIPETILSDPTRLRQIVTNLVGNAIKFTDHGGITLTLSMQQDDVATQQLHIAIRDTGIGMTPEQLDKIFDPFSQADTSTTRKYGGTGLGLSISKRLAESLGGGLDVTSVPGVGSTFRVKVAADFDPGVHHLTETEVGQLAKNRPQAQWQRVDLRGAKVLVVDDAETNRDLIRRLLCNAGASVECLENGQEAVNHFIDQLGSIRQADCDVVLMDMQMPVLDGYSATRRLRESGIELPIVAMTANSMVGDDKKCRGAGCSDYLSKPINLDALLETVRKWSQESIASYEGEDTQAEPAAEQVSEPSRTNDASEKSTRLPDDWLRKFAVDLVAKVHHQFPKIRQAYNEADYHTVAEKLHWIKGSGGTVGLGDLTELAAACESAAKSADVEAIDKRLDELQHYIEDLIDECADELPAAVQSVK